MLDLELSGVSKRYRIQKEVTQTGLKARLHRMFARPDEFWAVRDLSFQVPTGQALGIIGHNGAGKSTLLKLLSGITAPSSGEMRICGRLSALLEVGSGFHPELTGRENIFLSGSILGMKRREIHAKLERIIDFAEIRQFIDVPVKRYSSGMYVRLGFSIAAHLEPEILLLDEVLAVGDASFQSKCKERILTLKSEGRTIVFISHDLQAVQEVCDRVMVMQRGKIIFDGEPYRAIESYTHPASFETPEAPGVAHLARITELALMDGSGAPKTHFRTGEPMRVRISYCASEKLSGVRFDLLFNASDHQLHAQLSTATCGGAIELEAGSGSVEFFLPELTLHPNLFTVDVYISRTGALDSLDRRVACASVQVSGGMLPYGLFHQPHTWKHQRN